MLLRGLFIVQTFDFIVQRDDRDCHIAVCSSQEKIDGFFKIIARLAAIDRAVRASFGRREEIHMRTFTIVLVVAGILVGVIAAIRTSPAKITGKKSHDTATDYELRIRTPEGMKRFPPELVPLP